MKKLFVGLFGVLAAMALFAGFSVSSASAAPEQALGAGPYDGTFHGTVYASNGTHAPMSLVLNHEGNVVDGTVHVGEGLTIDAGICGSGSLPASTAYASGNTNAKNPRLLAAESTFEVQGIAVSVELESSISGGVIDAEAKIDLPWLCGGDVYLNGTFHQA